MSAGDEFRPAALLSIYAGRTCLGFIIKRGREGFEAFSASERKLGIYKTASAAADVVSTHASLFPATGGKHD
jgi:hypothetical protein